MEQMGESNLAVSQAKILGQVEKQPQCGDMYVEQTIINAVTRLQITKFELWLWRFDNCIDRCLI